jgi:NAD/NADP transhydrogenase alpha subunit
MVGVGGLFVMGGGFFPETIPQVLGALSVLLASVNVAGGFVITKRMLDMFKSESLSSATITIYHRANRTNGSS